MSYKNCILHPKRLPQVSTIFGAHNIQKSTWLSWFKGCTCTWFTPKNHTCLWTVYMWNVWKPWVFLNGSHVKTKMFVCSFYCMSMNDFLWMSGYLLAHVNVVKITDMALWMSSPVGFDLIVQILTQSLEVHMWIGASLPWWREYYAHNIIFQFLPNIKTWVKHKISKVYNLCTDVSGKITGWAAGDYFVRVL